MNDSENPWVKDCENPQDRRTPAVAPVRFNMESLFPGRRDDHNWLPTEIVAQPSLMQGRVRNLGGQKAPA